MKTYTNMRDQYGQLTKNTTTLGLTNGDIYINDSIRVICNLQGGKLRFLESTTDLTTVASKSSYEIPNKYRKLIDIYIYSGNGSSSDTIYMPEMIYDPTKWKLIKASKLGESDVPRFVYIEGTKIHIEPTPATTGNKITIRGRLNTRDLSIADYITGSIASVSNGGTAVVGNGTTWTADMVGRYIKINQTTSANGGDGFWYEIGGWTNATNITLTKPYEGASISAGTAGYVIGQVPVIPEAYQPAIIFRAVAMYWQKEGDLSRAKTYWMMYDGGKEAGYTDEYGGLMLEMLENEGETQEGSYVPPFGSESNVIQYAPYYQPNQTATGF
jgi:hypothetical protein